MKFSIYSFVVLVLFSLPVFVFAGKALDYTPLQTVTMPNSTKPLFDNDLLKYLANIYTLIIALAGALAVVKIVYAGIKYMTSEAFGLKAEAKKEIQAALIGLLMILGSYVFLYTLNPKLTIFNLKIVSTKAIVGDGGDLFVWAGGSGPGSQIANKAWAGSSTLGGIAGGVPQFIGPNGEIYPLVTAYSPQEGDINGNLKMEGGYGSSRPGPDGKYLVRTLEDIQSGNSNYVTLAGDPSLYGTVYTIPSISYTDKVGLIHTLTNVTGVVHDTGSAFTGKTYKIDVAVGRDYTTQQTNIQPFGGRLK